MMTPEEHQAAHIELHRNFDVLLACYLIETKNGSVTNSIYRLLSWSHQKTMKPTPANAHGTRDGINYGSHQQLILMALAELALSRPNYQNQIREIANYYDLEGLPFFESFMVNNADRVKAERGPLEPPRKAGQ